jgi:hypothetical protein
MDITIHELIALGQKGDDEALKKLEFWLDVMKLNSKNRALISQAISTGRTIVVDELIGMALAQANGSRRVRILPVSRVARAVADFLELPYYKNLSSHWISGGKVLPKDGEKAKTTTLLITRRATTLVLTIEAHTIATQTNLATNHTSIEAPADILKLWANLVISRE